MRASRRQITYSLTEVNGYGMTNILISEVFIEAKPVMRVMRKQ